MTCERYWREGILQVEHGEHDPHRDTCDDCRRAHQQRDQLVRALPEVGAASSGDPDWQSHVWRRIARRETSRARRSYWLGGGFAAACALAVLCLYLTHGAQRPGGWLAGSHDGPDGAGARPWIEIVSSRAPLRSSSARVGDRVRISVRPGCEVRIYRADRLVLRCPAWQTSPGCTPDAQGLVADTALTTAGEYQLVTISSATVDPAGTLDKDLAAVVVAGGDYKLTDLSVR